MQAKLFGLSCAALALLLPARADAFCGFYVGGAGADLFNNATQVVMMREGTKTVLSMQNNYQGPPKNFAMVVPVPVVLQKENVKTLPADIFARVDQMGAPRLVEYWEMDPCQPEYPEEDMPMPTAATGAESADDDGDADKDFGVKVEAQFVVGEYEIVILSAKEATGLEGWLHANQYVIPQGANAYLKPYVEAGSKFFVAKVDIEKVTMKDGMAMLSPLRFHYDTDEFSLPVRLGLMNAKGKQDLIVNILAPRQRYQTANYPNVTIPTNLDLKKATKDRFGEFYAALFDATLEKNPRAVVTEYAWDASTCDPCPGPNLTWEDFHTLGADVTGGGGGYVLTRLHARYDASNLGEDLVFKKAEPIAGGREHLVSGGKLEEGSQPSSINNFQARYAIRHAWTGAIACKDPVRGRWGGPPGRAYDTPPPKAARDLAFAPRGSLSLPAAVAEDIPELGVVAAVSAGAPGDTTPPMKPSSRSQSRGKKGCGCATGDAGDGGGLLVIAGAVLVALRRRRWAR